VIRVSVIIPTLDRPGPLVACLEALAVGYPDDAETIIVADGGSIDLRPLLARFVEPLRLRLLETGHAGPAAARNRGLEIARGEIVAFTDDDCRPAPCWLARLAEGVALSPPRAVGGSTHNGLPESPYADAAQLVLDLLSRHDRALARRERLLASNNFAFPAEALRRIGGFDESYRTAEDRELCRRWAAAGFELARVPDALVAHDTLLDLGSFVRKFMAYGRGAARFHGSGAKASLQQSIGFHLRLPQLLLPELRRRTPARAAAVAALIVVWEAANLAGFVLQALPRRRSVPGPMPAASAVAAQACRSTFIRPGR
jgi:GT2 family glycosyltransferase